MVILHIGLLSHFSEHMTYQENMLVKKNIEDGHEVIFISDVYSYKDGVLIKGKEQDIILENGMRLIRLEYDILLNKFISEKIQKVSILSKYIDQIKPDSILFHGCCGYELMNVSKYIKKNPNTLFYVDSHEDFNNTAKQYLSKLFYKYIHGFFIKQSIKYIKKILYISEESKFYLKEMYKLSDLILEEFPLGGELIQPLICTTQRSKYLNKYNLSKDTVIFAHTGKITSEKKTKDILFAFSENKNKNISLFIAGEIIEEKEKIMHLINKDDRVHYLGWIDDKKLSDLLCACDIYCQPGTQSATLQNALCCNCAVIVYPHESYLSLLGERGLYIENKKQLSELIEALTKNKYLIENKKKLCFDLASQKLDYSQLARRITK